MCSGGNDPFEGKKLMIQDGGMGAVSLRGKDKWNLVPKCRSWFRNADNSSMMKGQAGSTGIDVEDIGEWVDIEWKCVGFLFSWILLLS